MMPDQKRKIVLAGGSGFLGQAMAEFMLEKNYEVIVLGRRRKNSNSIIGRFFEWDAQNLGEWTGELENSYCLINLAGRSIDCRYTQENKDLILNSRIDSTRILGEAVKRLKNPPPVWLNASTATVYPDLRGDLPPHDENSLDDAEGFAEEVGRAWEEEFLKHARDKVRQVAMRISIVLGEGGGAFSVIKRFTQLGLGGTQGPGSQWMSWIHLDDWIGVVEFVIENKDIEGPVNFSSPTPVTNCEFMKEMRKRFAPFGLGLPAPTAAVHLGAILLGTAPELVLKSRKLVSKVLQDSGYCFKSPCISTALDRLS